MSLEAPTIQEMHETYREFKATLKHIEDKGVDFKSAGELTSRMDKIEPWLDAQEDRNQKFNAVQDEAKAATAQLTELKAEMEKRDAKASEISEALATLESEVARKQASRTNPEKEFKTEGEYKALNEWAKGGPTGSTLTPEMKVLLRTDSMVSGGFLLQSEMETFITKGITELNAMRALARVRTIAGKTIVLPTRTGLPTATYEGEAEAGPQSASAYGSETITAVRQYIQVPVTQDQLSNSAFDMESEISGDASLGFAVSEGTQHILGAGVKGPQGILSDARVLSTATVNSLAATSAATVVSGDDVILLQGKLAVGYEGTLLFNRLQLSYLRTIRSSVLAAGDSLGGYMWSPALDGGASNTLGGMGYRIMPSMPNPSVAGNKCIAVGDWRRAYVIVDRQALSVIRDDVTAASQSIVKFTFNRWNTAQVVLPEAIHLLTVTT